MLIQLIFNGLTQLSPINIHPQQKENPSPVSSLSSLIASLYSEEFLIPNSLLASIVFKFRRLSCVAATSHRVKSTTVSYRVSCALVLLIKNSWRSFASLREKKTV